MRVREHPGRGGRGDLDLAARQQSFESSKFTKAGRFPQHGSRVRSPDDRSPLPFRSLIERNEIEAA